MILSSYDIIRISIAGAMERHPSWGVSRRSMEMVAEECTKIDYDFKTGKYDLESEVDDSGTLSVVLTDKATGAYAKSWIIKEVFTSE